LIQIKPGRGATGLDTNCVGVAQPEPEWRNGPKRPGEWRENGMEDLHRTAATGIVLIVALLTASAQALAFDLTGAWATNADECGHVFARNGKANEITFAPDSEMRGGGFIAERNQLRGRNATCTIKATKDDGTTVNILAGCASDIMLSNVQFAIKVVDQNQITRLFPGMEDIQINYYRCPM
jgi:hypothetical protein